VYSEASFALCASAVAAFDPLADAIGKDSTEEDTHGDYVHIRVQQRNGKKSLTTVRGTSRS
jgi:translation initiation factor 1